MRFFIFPIIIWCVGIFIALSFWWGIASLAASGIKALSNNCDKNYKIEKVLAGDWFCE